MLDLKTNIKVVLQDRTSLIDWKKMFEMLVDNFKMFLRLLLFIYLDEECQNIAITFVNKMAPSPIYRKTFY